MPFQLPRRETVNGGLKAAFPQVEITQNVSLRNEGRK